MITPERWRRIQALVETLEPLGDAERRDRLADLERDPEIRRETLGLLDAIAGEEASRVAWSRAVEADVTAEAPPTIGGVRILDRLGSGGSGDVYRGVREVNGVAQPVAVKRFHADLASPEHVARFAREQQILATLTHPHIVRFLDGGTTDHGRPYLVMELADGQPITRYADEKRLRVIERVRLFLTVCDAVQAAHRQLVLHLDLKPSNVLVSSDGHVKLLDFGSAKLTDPDVALTRTEPLTLHYASPEQLRGEHVSAACDIYSLGLILYELVGGAWPFRQTQSIVAVAERAAGRATAVPLGRLVSAEAAAIRQTTIERLRATVRGDLEAITGKAIRWDPADRYTSVAELAEDLRRYLDGEPVRAATPTGWYRLRKFLTRYRWEVSAASVVAVSLAGAALYAGQQARLARAAAERAGLQNAFLTSVFTLAGTDLASRSDMTVRDLLALAEARVVPELGANPDVAADVETVLASGYLQQSGFAEAETLLERAIGRATQLRDVAREARARAHLAYVAYVRNRNADAVSQARQALALWEAQPHRFTPADAVATLRMAGSTLSYINTTDPAVSRHFSACLSLADQAATSASRTDRAECLRGLAIAYVNIESRYAEAVALLEEAVSLQRADERLALSLAGSLQMLGFAHRHLGRFAEDERAQRESYEILRGLQGTEAVSPLWQRAVWATSLLGVGRAEDAYREATAVLAAGREFYPTRGSYLLWTPLVAAAGAACLTERESECESFSAEALETLGPTPSVTDPRLATARGLLGLALARRGRAAEAEPLIRAALAMQAERKRTSAFEAAWRAAVR